MFLLVRVGASSVVIRVAYVSQSLNQAVASTCLRAQDLRLRVQESGLTVMGAAALDVLESWPDTHVFARMRLPRIQGLA